MRMKHAILATYIATIFAANWMIGNVGTCYPGGPCVIPVGFGLLAPSGVLMVGAALFLRDHLQEAAGRRWVFGAILAGAALSALLSPALALASGAAFLVSELADYAVYSPLRERSKPLAMLASGVVGGAVDSALFLWLAFGSLDFFTGQFVGKAGMALLGAAALVAWRGWRDLRAAA